MLIREKLAAELAAALKRAQENGTVPTEGVPPVQLDVPPSPDLGDFSSDIAINLAKPGKVAAAPIAQAIAAELRVPTLLDRVEVSSAGFLNFHLRGGWLDEAVAGVLEQGGSYGRAPELGDGQAVLVEFVSAYPTGSLTVNHGRGAVLGDALSNALEWSGYRVAREFYVNDAGRHMERFGRSLEARYRQALGENVELPQDGYSGEDIVDLARRLREELGGELLSGHRDALRRAGAAAVLSRQRETLSRLGVEFNEWYSELSLLERGRINAAIEALKTSGHAYDRDGAVWLRSTAQGDEEDRPLLRSNGRPTYLAGDLAYHQDKRERGFDRMIDIWNAEHIGYVRRTRAGVEALGIEPDALEILIFQPVALRIDGMVVEGGAIGGNTILLDEVIDAVGPAVTRFFYLGRPAGTPLEFDLDLARLQGEGNPALAVLAARDRATELSEGAGDVNAEGLQALSHPSETALKRTLAALPDEIRASVRERDPHRLARYAQETARAFSRFETDCPVEAVEARRALAAATRIVLTNTLAVLGVR